MSLRINDTAPDFTAASTDGEIHFHDWIGDGYAVLFSHPKDFTPICTTELGYMAGLKDDFSKRNAKIIGISVDPVESHNKWKSDIETATGHKVNYPMTTGRNFDEILRALDSIQLTAKHKVSTPANWKPGEDVALTGAVSDQEANEKFGGFKAVLPYLRMVKAPKD